MSSARSWLVLLILALTATFACAQNKLFGVGFVPFMQGGDEVEQRIKRTVSDMPEVDQMFNVNDGVHLLETLVKLKKQGRQVDFIVLGGHGAKSDPHIGFAKGDLIPQDVDLKYQKEQFALMNKYLAMPNLSSWRRKEFTAALQRHAKIVRLLEQIPGLMKPGAVVLLLNCSTAASDEGSKFVSNIANLLIGKDGGRIVASTVDIEFLEVEDLWDQAEHYFMHGGVKAWGDSLVDGSWVTYQLNKGSNKTRPTTTRPIKKPVVKKPVVSTKLNFTGKWDSSYGIITLNQNGNSVSGSSTYYNTQIKGTIKDGKLHYTWSDDNKKKGIGYFELSSDGQSFSGSWNYILTDGKTLGNGGSWGARRIGK